MDQNEDQRREVAQYINIKLSEYNQAQQLLPLNSDNVLQAVHDGVLLTYLFNSMSTDGHVVSQGSLNQNKTTLFHKLDQVNKALEGAKVVGLSLVNIRAESIVEMKENIVLGMFNQIMRQKPQSERKVQQSDEVQIKVKQLSIDQPINVPEYGPSQQVNSL